MLASLNYAFVAGLGLVALASSAYVCLGAWTRLHDVAEGRELVGVLSPTVKFVDQLARERGAYSAALVFRPGSHPGAFAAIEARQKETDALFAITLAAARSLPSDLAANIVSPIEQARNDIEDARLEVAPFLAPDAKSTPEEISRLIARFRSVGAEVDRALAVTERRLSALDPALGLNLEVSRLSNDIREDASQRSMLLALYIAGRAPLTADQRKLLLREDGEIDNSWRRLQRIAGDVGGFKVAASVRQMKAQFFDAAGPIYDATVEAALTGASPPMGPEEWGQWTVARLAETLAPRDAAIAEVAETLDEMETASIRNVSFGLTSITGLLFAFLIVGFYLQRRVLRPISILARAIDPNMVQDDDAGVVAAVAADFAERDDEIGALARAVARIRDRADDLQVANERFDALIDNLPHGVCLYDSRDFLLVANRKLAEIYGFPDVETLIGMKFSTVYEIGKLLNGGLPGHDSERFLEELSSRAQRNGQVAGKVVELPSGRVVAISGCRIPGGGWISTHVDITEQRRAEQQIAFIAEHDALTGLANRALFSRRLALAFQRADGGGNFAVMSLDLDRFKLVNDMLGHGPGDELLRQAARRLQSCIRDVDCAARIGGDEFALLLEEPSEGLAEIAERIIARLSEPYDLEGQRAEVSASVGIAVGGIDAETPQQLERAADLAMYSAKNSGRGVFRLLRAGDGRTGAKPPRARGRPARRAGRRRIRTGISADPQCRARRDRGRRGAAALEPPAQGPHRRRRIHSFGGGLRAYRRDWRLGDPPRLRGRDALAEGDQGRGQSVAAPVQIGTIGRRHRRSAGGDGPVALVGSKWRLPSARCWKTRTRRSQLCFNCAASACRLRSTSLGLAIRAYRTSGRFPFDRIKIERTFVREMSSDDSAMAIVRTVSGLAKRSTCKSPPRRGDQRNKRKV